MKSKNEKKMKNIKYKSQGRLNREVGARFELKVRADLTEKGWVVDRWTNNVGDFPENNINLPPEEREDRKIVIAKPKTLFINGRRVIINMWTGFPDFVANKVISHPFINLAINEAFNGKERDNFYEIVGVECKSNGYLTKEERAKCKWLIDNNVFSKILVAKKDPDKRGGIIYNEFK